MNRTLVLGHAAGVILSALSSPSPCFGFVAHHLPPSAPVASKRRGASPSARSSPSCPCPLILEASNASPSQEQWSCVAELAGDCEGDGPHILFRRQRRDRDNCKDNSGNSDGGEYGPPLSPREWMENVEAEEGAEGAYTVIRCELPLRSADGGDEQIFSAEDIGMSDDALVRESTSRCRRVWGADFHLERLKCSYLKLMKMEGTVVGGTELDAAIKKSEGVVRDLLREAELSLTERVPIVDRELDELEEEVKIVMLTLLWTPQDRGVPMAQNLDHAIIVRGHAFSNGLPSLPLQTPGSITATLALPFSDQWSSLPNRWESSPEAKLSSWCRVRRPLEKRYMKEGVGEVLLTRPLSGNGHNDGDEVEILEGLTSNLFIFYADGTLRTAGNDVLGGYARHLVLRCATEIGVKVDADRPILLSDVRDALWDEVFVTSSIRLITPLGRIIAPSSNRKYTTEEEEGYATWETIWSERDRGSTPLWRKIYENISRHAFI